MPPVLVAYVSAFSIAAKADIGLLMSDGMAFRLVYAL